MTNKQYHKIVTRLRGRIARAEGAAVGYCEALKVFIEHADCSWRDFERAFPPLPSDIIDGKCKDEH